MPRRWLALGAGLFLACGTLLACSRAPGVTREKPLIRFVDVLSQPASGPDAAGRRANSTADLPTASILNDTRFVLAAPPAAPIFVRRHLEVPPDGRISLRSPLPPELSGAARVAALPRIMLDRRWIQTPLEVFPVVGGPRSRRLRIELELPAELAGKSVVLNLVGYAIGVVDLARRDTPPLEIPKGASLQFAVGVLEHAWGEGPVSFQVSACEQEECEVLFSERVDPADEAQRPWRERRISLDALAGARRSFRFEARGPEGASFGFPLWANPTLYVRAPRAARDFNLVLISIDTLRADHLQSYGYERATAPFIDERFARGGTLFEHAVAAATTTTPSHMTMFTSLQPSAHGSTEGLEHLPASVPTLAEWIRGHAIDTAAITEDGWISVRQGFARGFDRFLENESDRVAQGLVERTFSEARRWLEANRDKRFFLFLHTYQVHSPYTPPEAYRTLFRSEEEGADRPQPLRDLDDYDREIRYTDDQLRQLFAAIDELGLAGSTIFVLTSDHGEEFREHGLVAHGWHLYEECVHVPLLIAGPTIPAGRRIGTLVGHVDLVPTLLELLGIPPLEGAQGASLTGLLAGRSEPARLTERPLFSESWARRVFNGLGAIRVTPPAFSVRLGDRKLARYRTDDGYRYEYYDLGADPQERNDRYAEAPRAAADLRELLAAYESRQQAIGAGVGSGEPPLELDPAQEEKLRALGYLED